MVSPSTIVRRSFSRSVTSTDGGRVDAAQSHARDLSLPAPHHALGIQVRTRRFDALRLGDDVEDLVVVDEGTEARVHREMRPIAEDLLAPGLLESVHDREHDDDQPDAGRDAADTDRRDRRDEDLAALGDQVADRDEPLDGLAHRRGSPRSPAESVRARRCPRARPSGRPRRRAPASPIAERARRAHARKQADRRDPADPFRGRSRLGAASATQHQERAPEEDRHPAGRRHDARITTRSERESESERRDRGREIRHAPTATGSAGARARSGRRRAGTRVPSPR